MTESERIAKIIYRAWISPFPSEAEDFSEFRDALDLYADARDRDLQAARMAEWKKNIESGLILAEEYPGAIRMADPAPAPEPEPSPADPPDTHTHTQPGPMTAKS